MEPLYLVMLRGMPEAFSDRRAQLEAAFREEMNRQFGDEGRAAGALHAHIDCDLDTRGLSWSVAEQRALERLAAYLPPGATFDYDLNWAELARPQH